MSYKDKKSFDERVEESTRVLKKYPERIPIVIEKIQNSDVPDIDKQKFLAPKDLTCGQFISILRKRINIQPEKALYIMINDGIYSNTVTLSSLYIDNKDEDGMLYIYYTTENTFGVI